MQIVNIIQVIGFGIAAAIGLYVMAKLMLLDVKEFPKRKDL